MVAVVSATLAEVFSWLIIEAIPLKGLKKVAETPPAMEVLRTIPDG